MWNTFFWTLYSNFEYTLLFKGSKKNNTCSCHKHQHTWRITKLGRESTCKRANVTICHWLLNLTAKTSLHLTIITHPSLDWLKWQSAGMVDFKSNKPHNLYNFVFPTDYDYALWNKMACNTTQIRRLSDKAETKHQQNHKQTLNTCDCKLCNCVIFHCCTSTGLI